MISPKSYLWFCKADGWQVTSFDPRIDPALGKPDVKCYVLESDFQKVTEALTIAIEALKRCTNAHFRDGRFIDVAEEALSKIYRFGVIDD